MFSIELSLWPFFPSPILLSSPKTDLKMASLVAKLANFSAATVKWGAPKLKVFLYYAKTELTPPSPGDLPQMKHDLMKIVKGYRSGAWKQVTVKQAWLNTLVTTEVICWFFVGEIVAKRHLIGYDLSEAGEHHHH